MELLVKLLVVGSVIIEPKIEREKLLVKQQKIAIDDLKGYWNQQEQELDRLYAAEVQRLQTEENEQEISLKENLSRTLENLELENCKVKAQYEQICKELFQDYSKQISQIDLQKTVQIEQINSAHTQQIAEITVQLTQTLTVINDNLEHTLRVIKRKCKITSINFILAPFALAGAYFAPLLFTSASATALAGIQSSLLATGLGSLVGALNKKAQIGIKVSLPIASTFEYAVPANNSENLTNNTITNSNQMYLFNLEKFQEKYQASVNQILTNKEKTENGLLYQLLKPILFTSDQYLLYKAAVKPRSALIESQDRSLDLKKSSRLDPLVKYNYYDPKFIGIKINVPNIFAQIWSFNHGHLGISMQYNKINTSIITANAYAVQVSSNNFSESNLLAQRSDFSVGFGGQLLIGCGRAFVKTGQGIKQLGLYSGEILGIVEAGRTVVYTAYINQEKALYNNTWVGQGMVARSGEILTDLLMTVAIPGVAGSTRTKLVAGSAITGAFIAGVQATEDGNVSSRVKNVGIGAVAGAVGGYALNKTATGLHWFWHGGKCQHETQFVAKILNKFKALDLARSSITVKTSGGSGTLGNVTKNFKIRNQANFTSSLPQLSDKTIALLDLSQTIVNFHKATLPVGVGVLAIRAALETKDFIEQGRVRVAHSPIPNIFITLPVAASNNVPGLIPPTIVIGNHTEFPGENLAIPSSSIFVQSDYFPENIGFPDLSSEFNRPMLLFSTRQDLGVSLYGGGKNAKHANQDARISARDKYEAAKAEYEMLRKAQRKTSEIVQQRKVAKKQMEHWKRKMNFSGENHSQKPKGGYR